jgi:hypothetical protein
VSTIQKVKLAVAAVFFLAAALFLHYNLPRTAVVQVTGTDVKRADRSKGGVADTEAVDPGGSGSRTIHDVRFINSLSREGETMVFRNEDTGWGWPPYFKFDSADLTAKAQSFATDPQKPWVRIRYYGWRVRIFSMFPNAVNLKVVERDYTHLPLFNIAVLLILGISGVALAVKFRGLLGRKRG